ncbi:myo-inositol oxygenase isoform X2 [Arctopsyche grandis]|uniref:myo-inositol oxygenase isoform X2 n=1 Tax=Arctopsyche grandis TaxID=121162 RepID=UPI00406D8FD5
MALLEINLVDPSQLLRPEEIYNGKPVNAFRDYSIDDDDPIKSRVQNTYKLMHTHQTVNFVNEKMQKWLKFDHAKSTIKEALLKLNDLIDESDPDTDLPNIVHAFQTAEKIRADHPNLDWFHLTGLIHDLGKLMAFYNEPQWCVVGDTFVVGCDWGPSIVYRETSFKDNPDGADNRYNTKYGMYKPHCGLDNVNLSWGHDEYLYRVLKHNGTKLPEAALCMIRYHSFYPWHAGGDYKHLTNKMDEEKMKWVLEFNKYDLYTKSEDIPNIETLWPYYESLIEKYMPGVLEW